MLVVILIYQQLENNVVHPAIQGKATEISPFFVILGVTIGSALLGVLGALVSVPVAASLQIVTQELAKARQAKVREAYAADPLRVPPYRSRRARGGRAMRARMITARILVVFAVLFAVLSLVAGFVRWQALDNDTFEATAELMIADDDVRNQIASTLVDELYANVDVAEGLEERLPEDQQALAPILAGALRELSDRAAQRLLERPRLQQLWVRSLSGTHAQLLRLLDDELTTVQTARRLPRAQPAAARDPARRPGRRRRTACATAAPDAGLVQVMEVDQLETAQDLTQLLRTLAWVFPFLALALGAVAIWLAAGRRRVILRLLAWGFVLAGVLVLVIRGVAGSYVVDELATPESSRPAVENAWEILTRLLADGAWSLIVLGSAAVLGVLFTRRRTPREWEPAQARPVSRQAGVRVRGGRRGNAPLRLVGADRAVPARAVRPRDGDPARDRRRSALRRVTAQEFPARAFTPDGGRRAGMTRIGGRTSSTSHLDFRCVVLLDAPAITQPG